MGADAEEPESKAKEPKPPKIKAEDNPWYLLATLYDTPNVRKPAENRRAWNRYFAARLHPETRAKLFAKKRHAEEELKLFSPEELREIKVAFVKRCKGSANTLALPQSDWSIDFRHVQFDKPVTFEGFLFADCSFVGAVFSPGVHARFNNATFIRDVSFKNAIFYDEARFNNIRFLAERFPAGPDPEMDFSGATFHRQAFFEGAVFAGTVLFMNRVTFGAGTATDSLGTWFR
jgi:Pentapeptide repeats (9 copies)